MCSSCRVRQRLPRMKGDLPADSPDRQVDEMKILHLSDTHLDRAGAPTPTVPTAPRHCGACSPTWST